MEILKTWVINISTLAVFFVIIEIIIPSGKMKKFIELFSGFILMIVIINPFLKCFNKDIDLKDFQIFNDITISKNDLAYQKSFFDQKQKKIIIDVYKEKIAQATEKSIKCFKDIRSADIEVHINENSSSDKFGEIEKIYINLELKNKNEQARPVIKINKIDIKKRTFLNLENKLTSEIKNKMFCDIGIGKDKIEIFKKGTKED